MSRFEQLTYINERGESMVFSRASRFHVNFADVSGLSSITNEIYSNNSMGQDGDTYLGNRIQSRDIEIVGRIKCRDKLEAAELRRQLGHVLNPQLNATLIYEFGGVKRVIGVTVNATEPTRKPIFQEFTIQLTCLNPYWREESETREDIAAWVGAFEFPVEIPIEGWEIGYREPSLIVNVFNGGDVKSGLRVDFRALGAVTNPLLLDVNTRQFIKLNLTMEAGDVLSVSTGYGQKHVSLLRNGIITDAFRYLDPDSSYMQLATGDNLLRYDADSNLENLEVSIYHNNYFLGV